MLAQNAVDGIARRIRATFRIDDRRDFYRAFAVTTVIQDLLQHVYCGLCGVVIPADDLGHSEPSTSSCIIRLVVSEWHDHMRNSGAEYLARRPDSRLMNNACGSRKEELIRCVIESNNIIRQPCRMLAKNSVQ